MQNSNTQYTILLQEADSEHASVMNELYRFYNPKASSVRSLMVANCVELASPHEESSRGETASKKGKSESPSSSNAQDNRDTRTGNPLSNLPLEREMLDKGSSSTSQGGLHGGFQSWKPFDNVSDISYSNDYCTGAPISDRGGGSVPSQLGSNDASACSPVSDMDSAENSLDEYAEQMDQSNDDNPSRTARSRPQKRQRDQHG